MKNLSFEYFDCDDILEKYSPNEVENRFNILLDEMNRFIEINDLSDKVTVNRMILGNVIIDYYNDIMRLESFHTNTIKANSQKVIAYTAYWILTRKPLQVLNYSLESQEKDDISIAHALTTINERFVLQYILDYLSERQRNTHILLRNNIGLKNFTAFMQYYLVYRVHDAQSIEMIIIAFLAGQIYEQLDEDLSDKLHPFDH